jgi:hypothetical protein
VPGLKPLDTHNSFLDALRSEITAGSENLSAWIKHVQAHGGIDSLFGLESWLKGIRSFFNIEHLPLLEAERAELLNRSFAYEIAIVRQAVQICESCAGAVLMTGRADKFEFEELIETQMRKDRILDFHISRIVEQLTPSDSVSQLLESLNDLRVTIDALKSPPYLDYQLFLSLGRSFQRDLKNCRYIDMLLSQRFRLQYDLIDNKSLTGMLRSISEESLRRNVALALLYLFRFLRYLRLISADINRDRPLRQHLVIFSLLHEEMENLAGFLKARFLKGKSVAGELRSAAELIAYSLKTESQRVFARELVFVSREVEPSHIHTRIETSHGLLRNCYQSCILTLVQAVDRDFDAASLFANRSENMAAAERTRQELWNLRQWLSDILRNREELDSDGIIERITFFRDSSMGSLMYRDWAKFEDFLDTLATSGNLIEIRTRMRQFVGYLEALIQEVSKRSTSQDKQLNP